MELDVLSDDVLIVFIVIDFWGSFVCQADCEIVILLCPLTLNQVLISET